LTNTEDEAPVFMSNLPSAKAVADAKNVDDLQRMFGPQRDYTDAWGGGHRIHLTERWTWFTADGKDTLRYLNVFAQVSWLRERKKPADIDILYGSSENLSAAAEKCRQALKDRYPDLR
jgi:hypothetical protein